MSDKKLYCVKCKKKQSCKNVKQEKDVLGKPRIHGSCKNCGCHCYQYVKKGFKLKSKSKSKHRVR